jgi:hypothetical protein
MKAARAGALALATTMILGIGAGTAWAPRVKLLPAAGTPCMVDLEKGDFQGSFGLQSFAVQNGVAVAIGSLVGTCSTDTRDVIVPGGTIVAVPVRVSAASCDKIDLTFGDASVQVGTGKVGVTIPGTTLLPEPKQVRGLMCAFAAQVDKKPLTALVTELNKVFARLS